MTAILEIRDLRKGFRAPDGSRREVLQIDSLTLEEGARSALIGGSGGGKSTLIQIVAGLQAPDAGALTVCGTDIARLPESRRDRWRAANLGIIFQTFNLLQGLTAFENVHLPAAIAGRRDPARVRELLDRVGLGERMHDLPETLSVGQQQRVAVARALMNRPALILADEPTGSLDAVRSDEAVALIRDLCAESGSALLFVTHDERILEGFSDVIRLDEINRVPA